MALSTGANLWHQLPDVWRQLLGSLEHETWWQELEQFIDAEYAGKTVYPPRDQVFHVFKLIPPQKVRVVILGQDPYHQPGQAHGLAFSVPRGCALPPSLRNIFREMSDDLNLSFPRHGNLESWVRQGVLLLNSVLTVEAGKAYSHRNRGWERFTDRVIECLAASEHSRVFVLWGRAAQKKRELLEKGRHLIIASAHPSPLSASRGFFGSRPFSTINQFLDKHYGAGVDWGRGLCEEEIWDYSKKDGKK